MADTPPQDAPRRFDGLSASRPVEMLVAVGRNWWFDDCLLWGAALAFHSLLSLAPLVYTLVVILGVFIDDPATQSDLIAAIARYGNDDVTSIVRGLTESMSKTPRSTVGVVVSLGIAILSASAVFTQLQSTLNHIWLCRRTKVATWRNEFTSRLLAATMIVLFGLTMLLSAALSWSGAALGRAVGDHLPVKEQLITTWNTAGSWAIMTLVIACIFRWLPAIRIRWFYAVVGGAITTALFLLGKFAVSYYIGFANVGSAYGAAGSIVVFVVWVYYTSQAFLVGAEITALWSGLRPCGKEAK